MIIIDLYLGHLEDGAREHIEGTTIIGDLRRLHCGRRIRSHHLRHSVRPPRNARLRRTETTKRSPRSPTRNCARPWTQPGPSRQRWALKSRSACPALAPSLLVRSRCRSTTSPASSPRSSALSTPPSLEIGCTKPRPDRRQPRTQPLETGEDNARAYGHFHFHQTRGRGGQYRIRQG